MSSFSAAGVWKTEGVQILGSRGFGGSRGTNPATHTSALLEALVLSTVASSPDDWRRFEDGTEV